MALVVCPIPGLDTHVQAGTLPSTLINGIVVGAAHQHVKSKVCKGLLLFRSCDDEGWPEEPPSVESFMHGLEKWEEDEDPLAYVQQFFSKACQYGFDLHKMIGNSFVELFAGCGSMSWTQQVFNRLHFCDEYSWSSLIQGFYACGEVEQAFSMLNFVRASYVPGYVPALMAVLKAAYELGYIECTQIVHSEIIKEELEKDVFFGSALVRTYTKFGFLAEAQGVFDEIADVDLILWNTLIGGYVDHGLYEEVMQCLREMQWQALPPSPVTIVYGLRACVDAGCLGKGRELCVEVFREGFEQDPYVASALLNMFAKCGSLAEAQDIFDELPLPNVVMWNTLISGFLDQSSFDEALVCYSRMKSQGLPGNAITFVCVLKACANTGLLKLGQEIHAQSIRNDYNLNAKVGNALLEMYTKCGLLEEALDVFSELTQRDVIAWTSIIVGFTESGYEEKALDCLKLMQQEGVSPNSATYVCGLKACGGAISTGLCLHLEIMKKGLENADCIGNALVDMYGKYGLLKDAQHMFDELPVQDTISYTAILSSYVEYGFGERAIQILDIMVQKGVSPSSVTYLAGLKACASLGAVNRGQEVHMDIVKHGFEGAQFTGNTLLDMYVKCGFLEEAQEVFNQLKVKCDVSWNTLIGGYADHVLNEQVLDCFQKMHSCSISPNVATFLCSLKACGNLGAVDAGREIHSLVVNQGCHISWHAPLDARAVDSVCNLSSALIGMYCKCGSMGDAQKVFDMVHTRETEIFNSLMTGYACQGESTPVFHLLDRMKKEDNQPNEVTFLSILTVCSHDGLLDKGQEYFGIMVDGFDLLPTVKHHTCVVDLFCRAGQLDEAIVATTRLPVQMDTVVWSSILSACYTWGIARRVSKAWRLNVE
ncbi:hypothetical protein GOP47_0027826 [Adiantum capillus-veneris]|nr:hypothetical protein GOP47_0027826 [Adiantum capillus-veneris]